MEAKVLNTNIIITLLQAGADPSIKYLGKTALNYAGENKKLIGTDAYEALKKATDNFVQPVVPPSTAIVGVSSNLKDFIWLVRSGTPQEVQAAIAAGAKVDDQYYGDKGTLIKYGVNVENGFGWTPLMHAAAYNSNPEVISILLKAGAKVDFYDSSHVSPLMVAASNNQVSVITILFKAGGKVIDKDSDGRTPLMIAAGNNRNDVAMILWLLANGAIINERDKNGWTPIMFAANYNGSEVINALLKAGADRNLKSSDGKTALDYAKLNYFNTGAKDALGFIYSAPDTPTYGLVTVKRVCQHRIGQQATLGQLFQ